jgi:tryptophan synthase beta chain
MTPLLKMHTLGHDFIPDPIHAGGLRYHGMSPLISHLYEPGLIEAVAKTQRSASRPACSSPAPRASCPRPSRRTRSRPRRGGDRCIETGEEKVILTALCGHGHLDLPAYDAYLRGDLVDHTWDDTELQEAVAEALTRLPAIPG